MAVALDHNGPCGTDFTPFDETWVRRGIVPRLRDVVRQRPAATAIVDGGTSLTYAALHDAARCMAKRIERTAPAAGAIGILLPPSIAFWIAILGCLSARRTYIALDLNHPGGRNAEILNAAGMVAVITRSDFDPAGAIIPPALPRISADVTDMSLSDTWVAPHDPEPGRPAIVLYTSGSTGRPKGVANSEAALLLRVAQYVNACHLHAGDRFLTLSSPCTIAGTREGLTALLIGATLHVIDAHASGLGDITRLIRDARITVFNSVPSVLRTLIAAQPDVGDALQSLRIVRIGGEVVFWNDLTLFRRALSPLCHIQIGYSSTETTGTQWFVPVDTEPRGPFVPVGYILDGNGASIVDDAGAEMVTGAVGELVLRSRYIALGTWDRGRCVAGDIRSDTADPSVRVLRTGDLARIDADGLCTIVGRKDRQVKINGMRVEPAEIEAALRDIPDIVDAAVIARQTDKAVTLTAFVVPRLAAPSVVPRIRSVLRARLPAPMRPSHIRLIAAIPHLPSGKLDVRALEALALQCDIGGETTDAAAAMSIAGDVRQAVGRAWRGVLGRRSLAEGQSFEDAGGDSLKLLQLVLSLETLRGRRLPLDLFTGDMQPDDLTRIIEAFEQRSAGNDPVDARPTIFLFPGLDGDEPRLANFRAELDDRMRFVPIDFPDWPEMVRRGQCFDALVELAVSQISAVQPVGALLLAGYSFGGDVAYAVATRLIELQRDVAFLGILDTDLRRVADAATSHGNEGLVPHFRQIMSDVPYDRLSIGLGFLLAKWARELIGLERLLRYDRVLLPLLPARTAFAFHRRIRTIIRLQAQWEWHRRASSAPIEVATVLFRSGASEADTCPDMGWRLRCPHLTVVHVGGDHRSMFDRPHMPALCTSFAQSIEATRCAPNAAMWARAKVAGGADASAWGE